MARRGKPSINQNRWTPRPNPCIHTSPIEPEEFDDLPAHRPNRTRMPQSVQPAGPPLATRDELENGGVPEQPFAPKSSVLHSRREFESWKDLDPRPPPMGTGTRFRPVDAPHAAVNAFTTYGNIDWVARRGASRLGCRSIGPGSHHLIHLVVVISSYFHCSITSTAARAATGLQGQARAQARCFVAASWRSSWASWPRSSSRRWASS